MFNLGHTEGRSSSHQQLTQRVADHWEKAQAIATTIGRHQTIAKMVAGTPSLQRNAVWKKRSYKIKKWQSKTARAQGNVTRGGHSGKVGMKGGKGKETKWREKARRIGIRANTTIWTLNI